LLVLEALDAAQQSLVGFADHRKGAGSATMRVQID
jgi:hypothetical protein